VNVFRAAFLLALASLARPLLASGCTVSSTAVVFGGYDVFASAPLDADGAVTLTCTQPVPDPVVKISAGRSGSFASRSLVGGAATLHYNLFMDAAHSQVWGDGTGGSGARTVSSPVDGQRYTLTIFGRVPARQNVPAGSYSDSLVVTIDF
jgi:spore coat protein U-like protein